MAFREPRDIINRALAHLGKERVRTLTDHTVNAQEGADAYDKLRLAELRRNPWRFATRRAVLRAIDDETYLFTPSAYASGTTYAHGAIVTYENQWWESQVGLNTGHTPEPGQWWQHYYGSDAARTYDEDLAYHAGELVVGSDDAVYRSLINANENDPVDDGTGWLELSGTTAALTILYPIGAGSAADTSSHNVYRLPRGFLRRAPTDPKAGTHPYLGGPVHASSEAWMFEGNYIVAPDVGPILLRYVADISDVTAMDPMFCEALAARIATEIGPRVVTAEEGRRGLVSAAQEHYRTEMAEARIVDGIEKGPVEAWEDDYISVRR
ncbi:MAG: hypothetical protein AB7H90_03495 [Alphaproteobacteria bacterium]